MTLKITLKVIAIAVICYAIYQFLLVIYCNDDSNLTVSEMLPRVQST